MEAASELQEQGFVVIPGPLETSGTSSWGRRTILVPSDSGRPSLKGGLPMAELVGTLVKVIR
jgi:hypothetical protein